MLGQSYFQLISPLIFLVFSLGFLLLWHQARYLPALRCFAFSYFFGACAMFGDFMRDAMHPDVASGVLSLLYLMGTVSLCAGLHAFYRGRVPWLALAVSAASVFALFSWLRFGVENMVACAWAINGGIAAMIFHTVHGVYRAAERTIDRILLAVITASNALLLVRSAIVFWIEGATMTETNYAGSLAAVTLQLSIAVAALAVAGVLFVMFGMEIVSRLTEKSETDPLTGVLNRRGLDARVAALSGGDAAKGSPHAVVMADIDRFKAINDRYGHEAGDAIIRSFAALLREATRDADFVVRWGGEEFLVFISHADTAAGQLFAEAVRATLETTRHDCLDGGTVTASFGVASWRIGDSMSEAAHMADMALYRAKREGRNRVRVQAPGSVAAVRESIAV